MLWKQVDAVQACNCWGNMLQQHTFQLWQHVLTKHVVAVEACIVGVEACIAVEQSFHRLLIICAQGKVHQIVMDL